MKPPELSDEDKALLERMKKARAAGGARRVDGASSSSSSIGDRWREPLGSEDGVGMFQPVPAGVPTGVVALDREDGSVLFRDGRCALEIDVAAKARLQEPPDGWDARLAVGEAIVDLRLERGVSAAEPGIDIVEHAPFRYAVRRLGPAAAGLALTFRWGGAG